METAVVARGVVQYHSDRGTGTSSDAEWLALIDAVEVALSIGASDVVLLGDSAMVVEQAHGRAKCRSRTFAAYLETFQTLTANFDRVRIRKIPRNQNLAGIALAKMRL
jgi:ribonuclease HI